MTADPTALESALAKMGKRRLNAAVPYQLGCEYRLSERVAAVLVARERLKRGLITIADLPQDLRRKLIDPANVDLHAIAAGPIMDSNQIYLPAGRLSREDAAARDAAQILPDDAAAGDRT